MRYQQPICPCPDTRCRDVVVGRRLLDPPGHEDARMARTVSQLLERLERSVERQRQFVAGASHELRTPVAGLRANLEDALMHPEDGDIQVALQAALRDTERIEAIIADLLLLARTGTDEPATRQPIDLAELVEAQVNGRKADIRTDVAPGVVVTSVSAQLTRLLDNLLDNAERHASDVIEIQVCGEGRSARLVVADDGPGIPPADRERVFAPFARLDTARSRNTGGFGLGLTIARGIARAHGGTLHIADSPRGARFVLQIPASPEADTSRITALDGKDQSGSWRLPLGPC